MHVFSQDPGVDWLVGWVLFWHGDSVAPLPLCGWEQQLLKDLAGERVAVLIFRQTACCCFLRCCLCGSTEEIHMEQHTRGSHPLMGDASCSLTQHLVWLLPPRGGKGLPHSRGKNMLTGRKPPLPYDEASSFMKPAKKFWERGVNFLLFSVIWRLWKLKRIPRIGYFFNFLWGNIHYMLCNVWHANQKSSFL